MVEVKLNRLLIVVAAPLPGAATKAPPPLRPAVAFQVQLPLMLDQLALFTRSLVVLYLSNPSE
jgi:hypothetical protein